MHKVQEGINAQDPLGDAKGPQKLFEGDRRDHGKRDALTKGNKIEFVIGRKNGQS